MIDTSNFKRGLVIMVDKAPCSILDIHQQSPTARGGNTLVKTKFRNILTGQVLEKTFKAGDKFDEAPFEKRDGQYLYVDGDAGVFMDMESYEQFEVTGSIYDDVKGYLLEGMELQLGVYQEQVISIEPPMTVELEVVEAPPAIKNATAQAQTKEAVLETGMRLQVPAYLESGERVKIDTREGRFVSRA